MERPSEAELAAREFERRAYAINIPYLMTVPIEEVFPMPYNPNYRSPRRHWTVYLIVGKLFMNILRVMQVDPHYYLTMVGLTALFQYIPRSRTEYTQEYEPRIDLRLVSRDSSYQDNPNHYPIHLQIMETLLMLLNRVVREQATPECDFLRQNLMSYRNNYFDLYAQGEPELPISIRYSFRNEGMPRQVIFSQLFYPKMDLKLSYYVFPEEPIPYVNLWDVKIANLAYLYWENYRLLSEGTEIRDVRFRLEQLDRFLSAVVANQVCNTEALRARYPNWTFDTALIRTEVNRIVPLMNSGNTGTDSTIFDRIRRLLAYFQEASFNHCVIVMSKQYQS